eukprot:CAMPEP_0185560254 /NCGR_PEP_ID=MMETSP1381-20130426/56514_1 /TAXON_ID=298111 /ORGANISM="Pavlova sp., Strain CCMP459" /LENGTH=86 /DNA_ID=CAMNT_0028173941 /DNA_START=126 /DNA_END=386 /DNA_ORIENTATION=-
MGGRVLGASAACDAQESFSVSLCPSHHLVVQEIIGTKLAAVVHEGTPRGRQAGSGWGRRAVLARDCDSRRRARVAAGALGLRGHGA